MTTYTDIKSQPVPLSTLKINPDINPRLPDGSGGPVQEAAAKRYAERKPDEFDPPLVFESEIEELNNVIGSGCTRYLAAKNRGEKKMLVRRVRVDSLKEAFRIAVEENSRHGLSLTAEERKAAAIRLHKDGYDNAAIADTLAVSTRTVERYLDKVLAAAREEKNAVALDTSLSVDEAAEQAGLSAQTVRKKRAKDAAVGKKRQVSVSTTSDGRSDAPESGEDGPDPDESGEDPAAEESAPDIVLKRIDEDWDEEVFAAVKKLLRSKKGFREWATGVVEKAELFGAPLHGAAEEAIAALQWFIEELAYDERVDAHLSTTLSILHLVRILIAKANPAIKEARP